MLPRVALAATVLLSHSLAARSMVTVPTRMELSSSLRVALPSLLDDTHLTKLDLLLGSVKEEETSVTLRQAAKQQSGTVGSVCFVVRRPG
jgi:hypothetical protein